MFMRALKHLWEMIEFALTLTFCAIVFSAAFVAMIGGPFALVIYAWRVQVCQ